MVLPVGGYGWKEERRWVLPEEVVHVWVYVFIYFKNPGRLFPFSALFIWGGKVGMEFVIPTSCFFFFIVNYYLLSVGWVGALYSIPVKY